MLNMQYVSTGVGMSASAGGSGGPRSRFEKLKALFAGMSPREIRSELRKKGELDLAESALFLGCRPQTLYNRICKLRRGEVGAAPRGKKVGEHANAPVVFTVTELEAWEKRRTTNLDS